MDAFDAETIDWKRLETLRDGFLARGVARRSDWSSRADLVLFDTTFARRIAWKWAPVLDEIARRGFARPRGVLLDWGAGTAVATREWLARFGADGIERVVLHDASGAAAQFGAERVRAEHPGIAVSTELAAESGEFALVLVSHVINELDDSQLASALAVLERARSFVWVEPGSHDESRALSAVRERLLERFDLVAPCTHRAACGVLAAGRDRDWCHFFAEAPQAVYTQRAWALFGKRLGLDLRSLPYSFLAMRRRAAECVDSPYERLLGRPRVEKGWLQIASCGPAGVRSVVLKERVDRRLFRALQSNRERARLARWTVEDGEVRAIEALER